MAKQFEIQDYDDGDIETGVTPAMPEKPQGNGTGQGSQDWMPPQPDPQTYAQRPQMQPDYGMPSAPRRVGKFRVFMQLYWYYKWRTIPVTLLIIAAVLLAVPATRYPIVGSFLRRQYAITLTDAKTGRPISGAQVQLGDKQAETDGHGQVRLSVRVGNRQLTIEKNYYETLQQPAFVGIGIQQRPVDLTLSATGRQVPLTVLDKVSNQPVADATVKVLDTSATTDKQGKAFIVLPTSQNQRQAAVTAKGYNDGTFTIKVTDAAVPQNSLAITPSGRQVFLSNANGSIDIASSNFDGTNRKTMVQGTGNEDATTQLFVSPDLRFAAMYAKRDAGNTPRLHILDNSNGQIKVMDQALAQFQPIGWAGGRFIYLDNRTDLQQWQAGQSELKSYNPDDGTVTTLDKSAGEGTSAQDYYAEDITAATIVNGQILYAKTWSSGYANPGLANRNNVINRVQPDGKGRVNLRSIPLADTAHYSALTATIVKPQTIFFQSVIEGTTVYYAYQNGTVNQSNTITQNDVSKPYPQYYVSPDGKSTYWSEVRDGKTIFFVGDDNAGNAKEVLSLPGYASAGWHGNGYLLLSKDSELYIMPVTGLDKDKTPLKISGYFTPTPPQRYF